jgi:2'-hydroxyisoflavone reductase
MRILILGGTGFTGPYQVRYALGRGHKVTTFNRGKSHPGELPSEVEQLIGDRNGQLDALKGRTWDVVIDNPTTLPVWVRDAAQILKGTSIDMFLPRLFPSIRTQRPVRTKTLRCKVTKGPMRTKKRSNQ